MLDLTQKRLYWTGNAAKAKVIREILDDPRVQSGQEVLIFDYGCGAGGDWKVILQEFRNLSIIGYDPSQKSVEIAKEKLKGENAEFLTGDELNSKDFKADFIVSFSAGTRL
jgi:ubiquinone/menaquinone biosynthesis C-methylase UbiE